MNIDKAISLLEEQLENPVGEVLAKTQPNLTGHVFSVFDVKEGESGDSKFEVAIKDLAEKINEVTTDPIQFFELPITARDGFTQKQLSSGNIRLRVSEETIAERETVPAFEDVEEDEVVTTLTRYTFDCLITEEKS